MKKLTFIISILVIFSSCAASYVQVGNCKYYKSVNRSSKGRFGFNY